MAEEISNLISKTIQDWFLEKEKIAHLFRIRDKKAALVPMSEQIASFLNLLFLINNIRVPKSEISMEHIEKLELKPINCKERLAFLMESPAHYHSFIQLSELYEELEKLYRKKIAIDQKKSRKAEM